MWCSWFDYFFVKLQALLELLVSVLRLSLYHTLFDPLPTCKAQCRHFLVVKKMSSLKTKAAQLISREIQATAVRRNTNRTFLYSLLNNDHHSDLHIFLKLKTKQSMNSRKRCLNTASDKGLPKSTGNNNKKRRATNQKYSQDRRFGR